MIGGNLLVVVTYVHREGLNSIFLLLGCPYIIFISSHLHIFADRCWHIFIRLSYHLFRWFATLENKTPAETFPKCLSVLYVIYVMLLGCDWWISSRSVNNMQDWWKFWKCNRRCFVFQSRVSRKTMVIMYVTLAKAFTYITWSEHLV